MTDFGVNMYIYDTQSDNSFLDKPTENYTYVIKIEKIPASESYKLNYYNSSSDLFDQISLDSTKEYYLYFYSPEFEMFIYFEEQGSTATFKVGNDDDSINNEIYQTPASEGDNSHLLYFNNNENTWGIFQTNITFYLGYIEGSSSDNVDGGVVISEYDSETQETITEFGVIKKFNFDKNKIYKIKFENISNNSEHVYLVVDGNELRWGNDNDEYYIIFDTNVESWIISSTHIIFKLKSEYAPYTLNIQEILSENNILTFSYPDETLSEGENEYLRLLDVNKTYKIILTNYTHVSGEDFMFYIKNSSEFAEIFLNNNTIKYLFYNSLNESWDVVDDYNIVFELYEVNGSPITMNIVDEIDSTNKFQNKIDDLSQHSDYIFKNILNTSRKYNITFELNSDSTSLKFNFGKDSNDFYSENLAANTSYSLIFENNKWIILETVILFEDTFSTGDNWEIDTSNQEGVSKSVKFIIGNYNLVYSPAEDTTTREDGWAILDSDYHYNQTEREDSRLTTTNSIDVSDINFSLLVNFESNYRFYDSKPLVIVSFSDNDSFNWPVFSPETKVNDIDIKSFNNDNNDYHIFDINSEFPDNITYYKKITLSILDKIPDGKDKMKIRFNWLGRWGYYWIIDDIKIINLVKYSN